MKLHSVPKLKGWIKHLRKAKSEPELTERKSIVEERGENDGSVVNEEDMGTQDLSEENADETALPEKNKGLHMKTLVRALGVARKTELPEEHSLDQSESTASTMLVDKLPHQHEPCRRELSKREKQQMCMDTLFDLSRKHIAITPRQRAVPETRAPRGKGKKSTTASVKTQRIPKSASVKEYYAASVRAQHAKESLKVSPLDFFAEVVRCSEVKCGSSNFEDAPEKVLSRCGGSITKEKPLESPLHCGPQNADDGIEDNGLVQGRFRLDRTNGLVHEEALAQVAASHDEIEVTKEKVASPIDLVRKVVQCGSLQDQEEVDHMELVRSETVGSTGSGNNIQYIDPSSDMKDTMVVVGGRGGVQDEFLVKAAVSKKKLCVVSTEDLQNDFKGEVVDLVKLILDKEKANKGDDSSTISTRNSLLATGLNPL